MKNLFTIIIFLFLINSFLTAQVKYMIYFKDKGRLTNEFLEKQANMEQIAEKFLSKKSIDRRKKSLGENYFSFEDLPVEEKYIQVLKNQNIQIVNKLKWFNAVSVYLNNDQLNFVKSLEIVKKIDKVRKIYSSKPIYENQKTNKSLNKSSSTNTFDYGSSITQNELSDIPAVHNMGITGEGIMIGLLDSGFEWETPNSLKNRNVLAEYDFVYKDNETANDSKDSSLSQHNHGTSVFSILAGFDEGNLIGPAFNADFLLAKTEFIPTETHTEEDNYAAALEWMDSIGVDITTSSLGYNEFDLPDLSYTYEDMNGNTTIVTKAAEMAFDKGIVLVTSAGNEGNSVGPSPNSWYYVTAPADGFNILAIGAVTKDNNISSFSSRGPTSDGRIKPELVAMGSSVINARAGSIDAYKIGSGTSFSAPITAGIAGLLLSAYPHLTNKQVRDILIKSGENFEEPDNNIGYGLISALRAVTYPNFKKVSNGFIVNKIFEESNAITENSAELVFKDGSRFSMAKSNNVYQSTLPDLELGENYEIYFNYKDSQNITHRVPSEKNFKFEFGKFLFDLVLTNIKPNPGVPDKITLYQNYPNPFNPETTINYSIPLNSSALKVSLKVFDILGRQVKELVNEFKEPGNHSIGFSSSGLSTGVYFYRLHIIGDQNNSDFIQIKKMTILK